MTVSLNHGSVGRIDGGYMCWAKPGGDRAMHTAKTPWRTPIGSQVCCPGCWDFCAQNGCPARASDHPGTICLDCFGGTDLAWRSVMVLRRALTIGATRTSHRRSGTNCSALAGNALDRDHGCVPGNNACALSGRVWADSHALSFAIMINRVRAATFRCHPRRAVTATAASQSAALRTLILRLPCPMRLHDCVRACAFADCTRTQPLNLLTVAALGNTINLRRPKHQTYFTGRELVSCT